MARVVCPEVSQFYYDYHTRAGVDIRCGTTISGFVGRERVKAVAAADGRQFPCDLAIVGIGIEPVVEPAASAGLTCENGIRVDEFARTDDVDIVAAGDCTNHPSRLYDERIRLESVQNAIDQAKTAALSLLGESQPYNTVPWFLVGSVQHQAADRRTFPPTRSGRAPRRSRGRILYGVLPAR